MSVRHIVMAGVACLFLSACATKIQVSTETNPPPREKFSNFSAFELQPLEVAPAYKNTDSAATAKIQAYLDSDLQPVLTKWSQDTGANGRTLVVAPRVEEIKLVHGATRVLAGPLAGSSAVIMKVRYTDKATGEVVADPVFYQRAAAFSGAATFGVQDNLMLQRIVTKVVTYTNDNYAAAVGGSTGAQKDK